MTHAPPYVASHVGPQQVAYRLTAAGRLLLPILIASILGGWLLGGTSGLLGALLLAIALLAPLLGFLHIKGLELALPRRASSSVGQRFVVRLGARNRSALFAVHGIAFVHGDRTSVTTRPGGFLDRIAPGQECEAPFVVRLIQRGRERRLGIVAHSTFPFGLVRFDAHFEVPCNLLCLPRVGALANLGRLPGGRAERIVGRHMARAGEEEMFGVRDQREGESLRRVHWLLSARRDRLIVREFRPRALPKIQVLLGTSFTPRRQWGVERGDPSFEKAVSLAATLVEHYAARGRTVRLGFTDESIRWTEHRGRSGLRQALVRLALLEATEGDPWLEVQRSLLSSETARGKSASTIVVVAGRGLAPRMPRGVHVIDVDESTIDDVFRRRAEPTIAQAAGAGA